MQQQISETSHMRMKRNQTHLRDLNDHITFFKKIYVCFCLMFGFGFCTTRAIWLFTQML